MHTDTLPQSPLSEDALIQARQFIDRSDLSAVEDRLVFIEGWSRKKASYAVELYRHFLFLKKKYPDQMLPPSYEIDEAWHAHVLHTKSYVKFCDELYGHYLHHHPYMIAQGGEEARQDADIKVFEHLFEITLALFEHDYGIELLQFKRKPIRIRSVIRKIFRTPERLSERALFT